MGKFMRKRTNFLTNCLLAVPLVCGALPSEILSFPAVQTASPKSERPLYYERLITAADLEGRSLRELSLMRNTIYARAGNPFRKKWLRDYFTSQPWYHPATRTDPSKLT